MSYRKIYLISYIFLNGDIFDYVIADFQPIIVYMMTFLILQSVVPALESMPSILNP